MVSQHFRGPGERFRDPDVHIVHIVTSNEERLTALPGFVDFYNRRRPHTALGGLSPMAVVNNVHGDHT